MTPLQIVGLYTTEGSDEEAKSYLQSRGLLHFLEIEAGGRRIPADFRDLARLHRVIRDRQITTVLEFGVGYSTLVMADAISSLQAPPQGTPGCFSVDSSEYWIARTNELLPQKLQSLVTLVHSPALAGTYHDILCHYFECMPDIVPDFIYLDGPDPTQVRGSIGGMGCSELGRVVLAADVLRIEPSLLPGTLLMVDGRVANVRFLAQHLYRQWQLDQSPDQSVTAMELQEAPFGSKDRDRLIARHGSRVTSWSWKAH